MLCKITITEGTLNRLMEVCDSFDTDYEKGINRLIDEHLGTLEGDD
jgi:hypothetical protein